MSADGGTAAPKVGGDGAREAEPQVFSRTLVYKCLRSTLQEYFRGKTYLELEVNEWQRDLVKTITQKIHAFKFSRYKFVVHVTITKIARNEDGSISSTHCNYLSGLWDPETDKMTMYTFFNETIYCLVSVCGIYKY